MEILQSNLPIANLKADLLQSDKNQVALPDETAIVNVVTSSSAPEPTLPVSLAATSSMDPLNPQLTPLQPLQCAMCGQMKATHPAGCPSYGVVCSACGLVGHKLVFCRKVIALKKSSTSSSRGQRQPKNKDNKTKRKRIQESSSEDEKPVKKSKKVTIAKEDNMYDSDPHVYMSLADIKETQHDEDSSLPSDSLPNQVSSTVSPTYILEALGAPIPPELVPNPLFNCLLPTFPAQYLGQLTLLDHFSTNMSLNQPMAYLFGHSILKIVGIQSLVIPGHAYVEDALTYLLITLIIYHHLRKTQRTIMKKIMRLKHIHLHTIRKILPTMVLTMTLTSTLLNYLPTSLPLLGVFSTLVPIATSLTTNLGLKVPTPILLLPHLLQYMGYLAPYLQLNNVLLEIRQHLYARQPKIMFYPWDG